MTRSRDLKALIRSRAAKTGERYTARRHVLAARARHADKCSATESKRTTPETQLARGATALTATSKGRCVGRDDTRPDGPRALSIDDQLASALVSALDSPAGAKPFALDAKSRAHVRYRRSASSVDIYIEPWRREERSGAEPWTLSPLM